MWASRLTSLLRNLLRRGHVEQDLDDELRSFLELSIDEKRAAGRREDEARRAALVELGGAEQVKERVREVRAGALLEDLWRDLAYACRTLRRSPGFAAVAVVSLGLAIGASAALFSVVDALFWRALPVREPERLVFTTLRDDLGPEDRARVGFLRGFPLSRDDLAAAAGVFAGVVEAGGADGVSLTFEGRTERVMLDTASGNYYAVLGVRAVVGRTFSSEIESGSWGPEAVLTHRYWSARFGADPAVVGRTILLNGYPFTIVGITPEDFHGTSVGDYSEVRVAKLPTPLQPTIPALPISRWQGQLVARLAPAVTLQQAQSATEALYRHVVRERFGDDPRYRATRIRLTPGERGASSLRNSFEGPLAMLAALAALVLIIACANLASLLLGRATSRRQEVAVRLAIGAGRGRLVRQLLVETLLVTLLGGALGLVLAPVAVDLFLGFIPQDHIRRVIEIRPDLRVLAFGLALAALSGLVSGLTPALRATRVDLTAAMRTGGPAGRATTLGPRRGLVVFEVAFSLLLLVGAALFAKTLRNLESVDLGFEPDDVALFTVKHVHERYAPERILSFCQELIERVEALPGVRAASLAESGGPFSGRHGGPPIADPASGRRIDRPARTVVDRVTPRYFESLGIPLRAGRAFAPSDRDGAPPVAIVDETTARALFPSEPAVGRRISVGDPDRAFVFDIVGVVGAARHASLREAHRPTVYLSLFQGGRPWMPTLLVRTHRGAPPPIAAVLEEFRALDRELPVFNLKTLDRQVDEAMARERLVATLSVFFAALAAFLVAIGLYGLMAHAVASRTREIGVRMALGARPGRVAGLVVRESLVLVAAGLAVGLALTRLATGWARSLLFGLAPLDPAVLTLAVVSLLAVAAAASSVPARRASRVDPTIALRYE